MPEMQVGDISDLLDIAERTMNRPKLKPLHDRAVKELEKIAQKVEEQMKEEAEAEAKEAQEKAAAEAAEAEEKAKAEKEAYPVETERVA